MQVIVVKPSMSTIYANLNKAQVTEIESIIKMIQDDPDILELDDRAWARHITHPSDGRVVGIFKERSKGEIIDLTNK